jgi:hypothetical protein
VEIVVNLYLIFSQLLTWIIHECGLYVTRMPDMKSKAAPEAWIPAFAGMTSCLSPTSFVIPAKAGIYAAHL